MASRPKALTKDMHRAAAEQTVDEMIRAQHLQECERGPSVEDLVSLDPGPFADGYSLAKSLDDHCGWCPTMGMVEILNGHSYRLRQQIEVAEKIWFEQNKPEPPLPIGTKVKIGRETGEITGIHEYGSAKYCVKIDGDPAAEAPTNSRRIINFEDAVEA